MRKSYIKYSAPETRLVDELPALMICSSDFTGGAEDFGDFDDFSGTWD
ncbi:MAG: hypothetical protein J1D85_01540 [Bacteroidales bacterium]|nr:hypothetical protein [Bacteroidales bacterium]